SAPSPWPNCDCSSEFPLQASLAWSCAPPLGPPLRQLASAARPRGIFLDASDPILDKAATPKTDRPACRSEELSDLAVLLALGAQQDDPRSLHHTHGSTPSSRERTELLALFLRENDWRRYSHVSS